MRTYLNEFGQKIRDYDWDELQARLKMRIPYTGQILTPDRPLVIRHTWGIGDVLYSTPALHGLRERFPDADIRYICTHPEVLEGNPDVNKVYHWYDYNDFMEISDQMEHEWYWLDYDVPLKGGYNYKFNLRTKPYLNEFMMQLLKKPPATLTEDEKRFVDQASTAGSVLDRYRRIALDTYCWHASVDPPVKTVYYYPTQEELEFADKFLHKLRAEGRKVIVLMPHASTPFKDYPHWGDVIQKCPGEYFWLILDSKPRREPALTKHNSYDVSGAFRMRQAIALCIQADLMCSSDTGFLYPRAARGKPCVVTYGPHEPEAFLHYFPSAHGLRVPHVTGLLPDGAPSCTVGCYIDTVACKVGGRQLSPCLDQLSPDVVASKVQELLNK